MVPESWFALRWGGSARLRRRPGRCAPRLPRPPEPLAPVLLPLLPVPSTRKASGPQHSRGSSDSPQTTAYCVSSSFLAQNQTYFAKLQNVFFFYLQFPMLLFMEHRETTKIELSPFQNWQIIYQKVNKSKIQLGYNISS